jgi:sugar transferase (PEP-CTERM system associated)
MTQVERSGRAAKSGEPRRAGGRGFAWVRRRARFPAVLKWWVGPSPGAALLLLDAAGMTLAALLLRRLLAPVLGPASGSPTDALLYPPLCLGGLYVLGLYRRDMIVETRKALVRLPLAIGLGAAGGLTLLALAAGGAAVELGSLAVGYSGGLVGAAAARVAFHGVRRNGLFRRRLLVIGAGRRAWDLAWMLAKEGRNLHYQIVFLHNPVLGVIDPRLADRSFGPVLEAPLPDTLGWARRLKVEQIVVAPDERRGMDLDSLLACKVAGFPVKPYLAFVEREIHRIDLKRMELSWLLFSDGFQFNMIDRVLKRTLDLAASAILLLAFGLPLLAAALAIRLDDGGPMLYLQERVTRGGAVFRVMKLRTMRIDAEAQGAVWAQAADPRITRIGAFLRRTRIDELPQLLNILKGEMSFVGPRPERPAFVARLAAQLPLYHERHVVKAGLTGWAQVNYQYGASIDDARSKLSYDLYYVKNFSILFDLLIIAQTLRVVLWPGGVR